MSSIKKIGIVIGHPTQFEGPLFQYIARKNLFDLEVIYYDSDRMNNVYDPELKMNLNWGIDLLSGYKYFVVPEKNIYFWIKDKLKAETYDLFIINGYNRFVLLYAIVLGKIYCKSIALRLDTVVFNKLSFLKKIFKKTLYFIFNITFDHFFAVGGLTVKYLKSLGIDDNKIRIFSYAIDNDFFKNGANLFAEEISRLKEKLKITQDAKIIISVAKFSEREAPWDLLKSFSLIKDSNLHLLLVGDGPNRNELEEYANNNFKTQVTFVGYIKYPELPKYYGISDLFVHTSDNEPWGVSVQEAMATGLPVITSDKVGASTDLIIESKNGFTYKVGDFKDLSFKIKKALYEIDNIEIETTNSSILNNWNYKKTMDSILEPIL